MKRDFGTLNALRGIAAMAVVVGHLDHFLPRIASGLFAVDLFFVMSGFVIAHAYEKRLASGTTFWKFAQIRAIRLYPLYAMGILLGMIVWLSATRPLPHMPVGDFHPIFVPFGLAMLPVPRSGILFPLDPVAWSLFLEVVINAVYALTWRHWTIPKLLIWLPFSIAAVIATAMHFGFDSGWAWENFLGGLARVSFGFPLGVLIYRLWAARPQGVSLSPMVPILLGLACMLPIQSRIAQAVVLFVLIPATVLAAVYVEPPRRLLPIARFMGDTSYAGYALHLPVVWCFLLALNPEANFVSGAALIGLVLLLSWLIHTYLDDPIRKRLTRMATSRSVRREATGSAS